MKCEVVCHQLRGPQGLYDTYGLRLTETGDFCGDITLDKAQAQALAEAYGEQLSVYAQACAKIFEKPVKEKIIYSFSLSEVIVL